MDKAKLAQESLSLLSLIKDALPLLGVIVGAGLQYFFSRSAETKRHERSLRIDAYSDYLRSVGEAETLYATPEPARRSEIIGRAIAAKVGVCVHGSASVVDALSKFEGAPGQGLTPEKKTYFLEFVDAVRADTGAKGVQLSQAAIEKILFGVKEPSNKANAADR
jgi:hypothetical protein